MDENKKGGLSGASGYGAGSEGGELRRGLGETEAGRELSESERRSFSEGYTTGGEDESLRRADEELGSDWPGRSAPGGGVSGMTTLGAAAGDGRSEPGAGWSTGGGDLNRDRDFDGTTSGTSFGASSMGMSPDDASRVGGGGPDVIHNEGNATGQPMRGVAQQAKETARQGAQKAKDVARARADQGKDQVAERIEDLSSRLTDTISSKADEYVSTVTGMAEEYIGRASRLLREKDTDELLELARREVRQRPLAVAAGFFALGFLGARLLRS